MAKKTTTVKFLSELYKKACKYYEKTTMDVTINEDPTGGVVYCDALTSKAYVSYKDMYDSLDLAEAILDDYIESHDKLNKAGLSDKELDVLLAPYLYNEYEIIFIAKGDLEEDVAVSITDTYEQKFRDLGCVGIKSEFWGNKKLAYPTKGYGNGWYYLFDVRMSSIKLEEFETFINSDENIIKHICVLKERSSERDVSPADADKEIRDAAEGYLRREQIQQQPAAVTKPKKEPVDLFNLICGIE